MRDKLKEHLQSLGIPSMVYYPVPVHKQKAYSHYRFRPKGFPVTEKLSEEVLSLPMHTELDNEQLNHIASSVINFFKKS